MSATYESQALRRRFEKLIAVTSVHVSGFLVFLKVFNLDTVVLKVCHYSVRFRQMRMDARRDRSNIKYESPTYVHYNKAIVFKDDTSLRTKLFVNFTSTALMALLFNKSILFSRASVL